MFDKWTAKDYMALFQENAKLVKLCETLSRACQTHDFDGLVIEVWSQLGGQAKPEMRTVLNEIGKELKKIGKISILVIPPPVYHNDVKGMLLFY